MKALLGLVRLLAAVLVLMGMVHTGFSLAIAYMVWVEQVPEGEPLWIDLQAPSRAEALWVLAWGLGMLGAAWALDGWARRGLRQR